MLWKSKKAFRLSATTGTKYYLKYGSKCILGGIVIRVIMAEQDLRELAQREEALEQKVKALEKTTSIEDDFDPTGLENFKSQLKTTQAQFPMKEFYLYQAEIMITPPFDIMYKDLRRDPAWFMRPEMVQDCSHRSGCCSRGCGCCQRRLGSKREKGRGHCTTECLCCANFRGGGFTDADKQYVTKDLRHRLENIWGTNTSRGWSVRTVMADWYFCPLDKNRQPS